MEGWGLGEHGSLEEARVAEARGRREGEGTEVREVGRS